jgi:hypothetical protein
MLSVEQHFKCWIPEGQYQPFMLWMSNAAIGRTNVAVLCWHGSTTDDLRTFLKESLPCVEFDDRIRCKKNYAGHVIVFQDTYPRTRKQVQKIRDLHLEHCVVFANPPESFCIRTRIPRMCIHLPLQPVHLSHSKRLFSTFVKFYLATSFQAPCLHRFLADAGLCSGDIRGLYTDGKAYVQARRPGRSLSSLKEFLAVLSLIRPNMRIEPGSARITGLDVANEAQTRSLFDLLSANYENGVGMFMWMLRVMMGIVAPKTVLVIEDPTDFTTSWMTDTLAASGSSTMFVHAGNLGDFSCSNVRHDAYVLGPSVSTLIPVASLTANTNVAAIVTNAAYMIGQDPFLQCIRCRYRGSTNAAAPPAVAPGMIAECYKVIVKEPSMIPFLEEALTTGAYAWGALIHIDRIFEDYFAYCDREHIPKIFETLSPSMRKTIFTIFCHSYFDCFMFADQISFWKSRKLQAPGNVA